jgi:hypothetical protein
MDGFLQKVKFVKVGKPSEGEIPEWDVALESLIRDEVGIKGGPLNMEDFKRLAKEHAIRFDDIMATLVQLVRSGRWQHTAIDDDGNQVDEKDLDGLYVYSRVEDSFIDRYNITWEPVAEAYSEV